MPARCPALFSCVGDWGSRKLGRWDAWSGPTLEVATQGIQRRSGSTDPAGNRSNHSPKCGAYLAVWAACARSGDRVYHQPDARSVPPSWVAACPALKLSPRNLHQESLAADSAWRRSGCGNGGGLSVNARASAHEPWHVRGNRGEERERGRGASGQQPNVLWLAVGECG